MKIYYVYELIDPRDGIVFYVGKGKNNRMYEHVNKTKKGKMSNNNPHLYYKIKQILENESSVKYNVILENESEEECFRVETETINKYGLENLTNIADGGLGGYNQSAVDINRQIRLGKTWEEIYGKEQAEQMKIKWSEMYKGKNNPFFGKHHSDENKKLFSDNAIKTHTGRKRSDETKKNLSLGISNSEKHKAWRDVIKSKNYRLEWSNTSKQLWSDPEWRQKNIDSLKNRTPRSKVYTDDFMIDMYSRYLKEKENNGGKLSFMKYYKSVGIKSPQYFHYLAKQLTERKSYGS